MNGTYVEDIATLARDATAADQLDPNGSPLLGVRDESGYRVIDLSTFADFPTAKSGEYRIHDAESFGAYVNAHKVDSRTALFADLSGRTVVAILDGNEQGLPGAGWGRHRATYQPQLSDEWVLWTHNSGQMMPQKDFAEFILDGIPEIVQPDSSDMLELAHSLEVMSSLSVKGRVQRQGGNATVAYEEDQNAIAPVQIPEQLVLGIKPFVECPDAYRVEAQFRYRLDGNRILMGFRLIRPDRTLRAAFDDILAKIADDTLLVPFKGVAPAAVQRRV